MPAVKLTRWPDDKPPTRSQLYAIMRLENLSPVWWSNGPGDPYREHSHSYNKVLFCLEGSIVFRDESTGADYELQAGDRLEIPRGTQHSAIVGPHGCTCVEAQAG